MTYKTIAGISTDMMALGIAKQNIKLATKKKPTAKDIVKAGIGNVAGLSLLTAQAQLVGSL